MEEGGYVFVVEDKTRILERGVLRGWELEAKR